MAKSKGKKPKNFNNYARDAFEKSLITSFPEIATSKQWWKKYLKIAVFIISLCGLVYQTIQFLQLYLSYPTVVDVQITNPADIEQPAFTICNENKRRRSVVCEKKECNCTEMDGEEMCKKYPQYCPDQNFTLSERYLKVPILQNVIMDPCSKDLWPEARKESHTNDTIRSCVQFLSGKYHLECNLTFRHVPVRETQNQHKLNMCYIVDSQVGQSDAKPTFHDNMYVVNFDLLTSPEEYLDPALHPSILIAVHDRKALINPYVDGTMLRGGKRYNAYISMMETISLPPPYQTNCVDYREQWKKRNGTGPLTQKMCIEYCKMTTLLAKGRCMDTEITYPNEEPVCSIYSKKVTDAVIKNCTMFCGNPCIDQTYEVKYEEINDHQCGYEDYADWCKNSFIALDVLFNRYTVTSVSYQPKFDSIELFSYIGGYIGMWIGLSLVSLFDLIEILCHLAYYPMELKNAKKNVFHRRHRRIATY